MWNRDAFRQYLLNEYLPAQTWALSDEGRGWIARYVPGMNVCMEAYGKPDWGIYLITFNGKPVYCGESVKTANRLCVHLHHLCNEPYLYFGISKTDIEHQRVSISIEILQTGIKEKRQRKQRELHYIDTLKPALQRPGSGTDLCIRREARPGRIRDFVLGDPQSR